MTPEQFCYWLQGFCELNHCPPNEAQWQSIRDHLNTVFKKVTPSISDSDLKQLYEKFGKPREVSPPPLFADPKWVQPLEVIC